MTTAGAEGVRHTLARWCSRVFDDVFTSHNFRREGKWRQRHYDGSIDDPDVLADYQSGVGG